MIDNKMDQMNVFANTVLEPGKSPIATHAEDRTRIVDGDNFWSRLKKKLFGK